MCVFRRSFLYKAWMVHVIASLYLSLIVHQLSNTYTVQILQQKQKLAGQHYCIARLFCGSTL